MKNQFKGELERVINDITEFSINNNISTLNLDVFFLSLIKNDSIKTFLTENKINVDDFSTRLEKQINNNHLLKQFNDIQQSDTQRIILPTQDMSQLLQVILGTEYYNTGDYSPLNLLHTFTEYCEKVFADSTNKNKGIYSLSLLDKYNITTALIKEEMAKDPNSKLPNLSKYGVNLSELAANGKIDPVIGRNNEVVDMVNIIGQRRKNNPLLVGDAGVGKTTIAEGLALKIHNKEVPEALGNLEIYSLPISSLMAGTKFRGDLEERLQKILKEAEENPNVVLFIDEIHQILSNSSENSSSSCANILKPALANGKLKVIGATTFKEYREIFQKDSALERRFQKIDIKEPTPEDAKGILLGLQSKFEEFHKVKYTEDAIKAAVDLSVRFLPDRQLPDKAIDLIDMAGSRLKLNNSIKRKVVDEDAIVKVIASLANVPVGNVAKAEKTKLVNLEDSLKAKVFGQNDAIKELVTAITVSRAGLAQNKNKPIGNFLFAGPTGTGKTELAKSLSEELSVPLIRFDMSEFGSKHEVAKFLGSPPGYVGHNEGGKLTEQVKQNPYSVVLLDEIEKAHPDIFNVLLQVMDDGRLTDGQGRTTSFKNVILILTTNAGAQVVNKRSMGFTTSTDEEVQKSNNAERTEAVKKFFSPEFNNRLDSVIQFNELTPDLIRNITNIKLNGLRKDLAEKEITIDFTDEALDTIAKNGFDKVYGARPLNRYIQKHVIAPLSVEVVHNDLSKTNVKVDFKDNSFKFDFNKPDYSDVINEKATIIKKINRKTKGSIDKDKAIIVDTATTKAKLKM